MYRSKSPQTRRGARGATAKAIFIDFAFVRCLIPLGRQDEPYVPSINHCQIGLALGGGRPPPAHLHPDIAQLFEERKSSASLSSSELAGGSQPKTLRPP